MTRNYPAKILLFGEYTILLGTPALAVPIQNFRSQWDFSDAPHPSQVHLHSLLQYLKKEQCSFLDLHAFDKDMKKGLLYDTTIPIGYGAGSSGSVSAAILHRYATQTSKDQAKIRTQLQFIEDNFHGKSSGLDPLVSYYQKPVLIDEEKQVKLLPDLDWKGLGTFFLIDTLKSRSTAPLVEAFKERLQKEEGYESDLKDILVPDVKQAINNLRAGNATALFDNMHSISMFQFKYFKTMILPSFHDLWLKGLSGDLFKLKLCGAGGGGYILGWTQDYIAAKKQMRGYKLLRIT